MKEIADMAEPRGHSDAGGEPATVDVLGELGWPPCAHRQVLAQRDIIAPELAA